ncbi:Ldh family oxidoreductase [Bradyrhizobium sp. KB893862 SZCCT0404]|uniref:Ldh family oxidoreductase n=1 Tax=Bradyrhizobium sp. KB893862 SZCCT0404 TaxID=2807672 RepID=UPI001BAA9839|nr:Ldh family oxidoreductase [Bradyrhizobium sp. KB893862 SZCCT0404]MBR1177216.1 Ldh family oxidoreductase [Bradyrhizobium sp. KB893862 SZCCT0404]
MAAATPATAEIRASDLARVTAALFTAAGVAPADAEVVADDLVAADVEGVPSHGVMLVPMYLDRLAQRSISTSSIGKVVSERDGAIVLDAGNALGQLIARQALRLAVEKARQLGVAVVAVRNAFHFGTAGRYARIMADLGFVGIVMSNTRPLMPAPGGAEALVGNNPIAIAVPTRGPFQAETDLALSATAMGKVRLAAAAGRAIPEGWAADAAGAPTTDPHAAIKGMLLPAAGPKGFGLAFMVDMLCGGLSGGAVGAEVKPLYGDPGVPYGCSQFFLAIDVGHFPAGGELGERVAVQAARVSASRRAPGHERVYAPGELAFAARENSGGACRLGPETVRSLIDAGRKLGIILDDNLAIQKV